MSKHKKRCRYRWLKEWKSLFALDCEDFRDFINTYRKRKVFRR